MQQARTSAEARSSYLEELAKKLPWQYIADSPTTKHYTDWSVFEKILTGEYIVEQEGYEFSLKNHDILLGCDKARKNKEASGGISTHSYRDAPSEYRRLFGRLINREENRLTAIHYARLREPYIISVTEPGAYRIGVCSEPGKGWRSTHLVIYVPENASASLLLEIVGSYQGSLAIEVFVEKDSSLELLSIARPSKGSTLALMSRRRVGMDAKLVSASLYRATRMSRIEEETLLQRNAWYSHRGIAIGLHNERIDYITNTFHDGRESTSNVELFGFALDKAFVSARGVSTIREHAENSSAYFNAEVLILGEEARAYTMPLMEINTGQVEAASHHAAQYRIPKDMVFYMQTRGLGTDEVIQLLPRERVLTTIEKLVVIRRSISDEEEEKLVRNLLT